MKWFGESWGAPICDASNQAPVPVGEACPYCTLSFKETDSGVILPYLHDDKQDELAWHLECFWKELGIDKSLEKHALKE